MNYFHDCTTPGEVKTLYRRLAMRMHPDRGGDTATFQSMQVEYLSTLERLDGSTEKGSDGREHTYYYRHATESELMDKINELIGLDMEEVRITLIGTWIWVTGNTKPYAKLLGRKGVGLYFHSKREAWCWHMPTKRKTRYNPRASLQDLEESYGSRDFVGARHYRKNQLRT